MSAFEVNRLCRDVMQNPALRERLATAPALVLSRYDLTEEEMAYLRAGDVGALHQAGANDFLLGYLARYRAFGLDFASYGERMRAPRAG